MGCATTRCRGTWGRRAGGYQISNNTQAPAEGGRGLGVVTISIRTEREREAPTEESWATRPCGHPRAPADAPSAQGGHSARLLLPPPCPQEHVQQDAYIYIYKITHVCIYTHTHTHIHAPLRLHRHGKPSPGQHRRGAEPFTPAAPLLPRTRGAPGRGVGGRRRRWNGTERSGPRAPGRSRRRRLPRHLPPGSSVTGDRPAPSRRVGRRVCGRRRR